jgi:hypothetical protein
MADSAIGVELRATAWPVVAGVSALAAVTGAAGVAWPGGGPTLLPISFALLAAAAAFLLDEPASPVVDVTPTSPARRTAVRALALLVPLAVGVGLVLALALRAPGVPGVPGAGWASWPAVSLVLAGNVLLGFTVACVARRWVGEPGPQAAFGVVAVLVVPGLVPPLSRWIHTFPAAARYPHGLPVTVWWWAVVGVCAAAIAVALTGPPARG